VQEHIRAKGLRKDTAGYKVIIKSLEGINKQKDYQLKQDTAIFAVKDSATAFWKDEYGKKDKQAKKAEKRADRAILLNKLLGVAVITLVVVLGVTL
jgi:hypothetical protein